MRTFFATSLILALGLGCGTDPEAKDPLALLDIQGGKADGSLEVFDSGELTIGTAKAGEIAAGEAERHTFTLSADAEVTLTTTGDEGLDTVLYLQDAERNEIGFDDDGGANYFSSLTVQLEAGDYAVVIAGYDASAVGAYSLTATQGADVAPTCGDGICSEGEECEADCEVSDDPWAMARDVNLGHVEFTDATPIPENFQRADVSFPSLSSPEWWQRWSGGATQSFSWGEGTDFGKRCAQASTFRLEALMASERGRAAFESLRDGSNWRSTMYNWSEDVSEGGRASFESGLWAWRTSAIKFINLTNEDGSCDLITVELLEEFVENCLADASANDGEIQGCIAQAR